MTCEYTLWDGFRIALAIGFGIYMIWISVIAFAVTDMNMKIGLLGLGFTLFGVGISLISSVFTEKEIRKLKK